jgi:hypothetical protein
LTGEIKFEVEADLGAKNALLKMVACMTIDVFILLKI